MIPSAAFWAGRRVLVTGHTGFKGSWLALWLRRLGATVTGIALPPDGKPNLFGALALEGGMRSTMVDINDAHGTAAAIRSAAPEVVLHLAAQSLVRRSYAEPVATFATNVMGTVHVLEAARQCGTARAVVVVTSDKCYENREWLWPYRESDRLGGHDPYSASKACAEIAVAAWRQSFPVAKGGGPVIATARAGNVIGGGDWAQDRLVPDCLRALEQGHPIELRNPGAVRPWQHVLEPLNGYLMLAERLHAQGDEFAGAWNFGPADESVRTVEHVATGLAGHWGAGARLAAQSGDHPHEATLLRVDSSKARGRLGWSALLRLDDALAWTVEWHKAWRNGASMQALTGEQIDRFMQLGSGTTRTPPQ